MCEINPGDVVRKCDSNCEMLVIGYADEHLDFLREPTATFCVWEVGHLLFEAVILIEQLVLVRRERRRVPRGGVLHFPQATSNYGGADSPPENC